MPLISGSGLLAKVSTKIIIALVIAAAFLGMVIYAQHLKGEVLERDKTITKQEGEIRDRIAAQQLLLEAQDAMEKSQAVSVMENAKHQERLTQVQRSLNRLKKEIANAPVTDGACYLDPAILAAVGWVPGAAGAGDPDADGKTAP